MCTNKQKHMQHTSVYISVGEAVTFNFPIIFPSLVGQHFLFFRLRFCGQRNQVHYFVLYLKIILSYNLGIVLIKKNSHRANRHLYNSPPTLSQILTYRIFFFPERNKNKQTKKHLRLLLRERKSQRIHAIRKN